MFYGVVFSPGGKRAWASGGGQNVVHVYDVGKTLKETGQIPTPYFPAGLAYGHTPRGDRIYVANNLSGVAGATNPPGRTVTVIDPKTNHVIKTIDLGAALQPYGVAFGRNGRKAYVTNWMGRSVSVIDTRTETRAARGSCSRRPTDPQLADHPERDRRQPAPQRGLHRQRQLRHRLGHQHEARARGPHDGGRARARRAHRLDAQRARGRARRQAALRRARRARTRSPCSTSSTASAIGFIPTAWNPTDVDITRNGKRLAITSANAAGRFPRRCAGPVRGRRLLDRRLRLRVGGPAAEHEGRHQRGDDAEEAQDAAHSSRAGAAQQPRAGADRGASRRRSARSATSST